MTKMIAAKGFTYATRRLLPEDPFTARTRGDARALEALGKARYATRPAEPGFTDEAERPALRQKYEQALGKKPFAGWNAETLRAKIAEAKKD